MFGWFTNAVLELWAYERRYKAKGHGKNSWRRFKQRLFRRDGGLCRYCGTPVTFENATIDEVIPRAHGGRRELDNCVLACWKCNHLKGPLLLENPEDLSVDALRNKWASMDAVRSAELAGRRPRLPQ